MLKQAAAEPYDIGEVIWSRRAGLRTPAQSRTECADYADFQAVADAVHDACCRPSDDVDCSSGMPATCVGSCGDELVRFHDSCATFLAQPLNKAIKALGDNSIATGRGGIDLTSVGKAFNKNDSFRVFNVIFFLHATQPRLGETGRTTGVRGTYL